MLPKITLTILLAAAIFACKTPQAHSAPPATGGILLPACPVTPTLPNAPGGYNLPKGALSDMDRAQADRDRLLKEIDRATTGQGNPPIPSAAKPNLPPVPNMPEVKADPAATKANEVIQSKEHAVRTDGYKHQLLTGDRFKDAQRILELVDPDYSKDAGQTYGANNSAYAMTQPFTKYLAQDERIYIFVSSSVPQDVLREYARVIHELGDPNIFMVMRGFVDGGKKVAPTMHWLQKILIRNPECLETGTGCDGFNAQVVIDPNLFNLYKPEVVPAFVYVDGLSVFDSDASEGLSEYATVDVSNALMLYGDPAIRYATRLFLDQKGNTSSNGLRALYAALVDIH